MSSYAKRLTGTRDVRCNFKINTTLPTVNVSVKLRRVVANEIADIKQSVVSRVNELIKIETSNMEIILVSQDGISQCQPNDMTEDINFIGVNFVGLENTAILELVTQIKNLQNDVRNLKEWQYQVRMRVLIEKGRMFVWSIYEDAYKNNFNNQNKYLREINDFDDYTEDLVIRFKPKNWNHFVKFVSLQNPSTELLSILPILKGGIDSDYALYTDEIHGSNEEDIAEAVKFFDDNMEKQLFKLVFGKSVDDA